MPNSASLPWRCTYRSSILAAIPAVKTVGRAQAHNVLNLCQLDAGHGVIGVLVGLRQPEQDPASIVEVILVQ